MAKRAKTETLIYDEKNYTVVGINGYRRGSLTFQEAHDLASKLNTQMKNNGWSGRAEVYYRDGSRVEEKGATK